MFSTVVRRSFVTSTWAGLYQFEAYIAFAIELGLDTFRYRTFVKAGYTKRLTALDDSLMETCVDVVDVDDGALCFMEPQLGVNFRFDEKVVTLFWPSFVHNECRVRTTTCHAVFYQYLTQKDIAAENGRDFCEGRTRLILDQGTDGLLCGASAGFFV